MFLPDGQTEVRGVAPTKPPTFTPSFCRILCSAAESGENWSDFINPGRQAQRELTPSTRKGNSFTSDHFLQSSTKIKLLLSTSCPHKTPLFWLIFAAVDVLFIVLNQNIHLSEWQICNLLLCYLVESLLRRSMAFSVFGWYIWRYIHTLTRSEPSFLSTLHDRHSLGL